MEYVLTKDMLQELLELKNLLGRTMFECSLQEIPEKLDEVYYRLLSVIWEIKTKE